MTRRRMNRYFHLCAVACLTVPALVASAYHGQVAFGDLPVPGATVTVTGRNKKFSAVTDLEGRYFFPDLADGAWTIEIRMLGFETVKQDVVLGTDTPAGKWELKLLPLNRIEAQIKSPAPQPVPQVATKEPEEHPAAPERSEADFSQRPADGFLINGSVNNGAASPFAQAFAFGNHRTGGRGLYNGGIGIVFDNSALDARPFSLTGQNTPKAAYNQMTGLLALAGPLRIPHVWKNGPNFFVGYEWTRNRNSTTQSALMPDAALRSGSFSGPILDPASGTPFPGNTVPTSRISPQAQALLHLYPLPNFTGSTSYNYQVPIVTPLHQDALQSRLSKTLDMRDQIYGRLAFQNTRTDSPNVFGFLDTTDSLGFNAAINWSRRIAQRSFLNFEYEFSRFASHVTPYFENRTNVSGEAGILGNNQDPANWGPPGLTFSSGIAGLSDAQSSFNRNQTSGLSVSLLWSHRNHNISFGGGFRRQQFNDRAQQNPRGAFTFTGSATGSDFADFLLGVPSTSSIAFGNADKYFRESVYDAFVTDDWRIGPQLTLNAGMRWEYCAPITELYGRLVNLDIAPGFSAAMPVVASDPTGALTGQRYPSSLLQPDKSAFEPRIGVAWRPISGSSMVIRAGYGMYYDTSVYQTIAVQMAQQPPLSKTLSVQNTPANPLTLANGFVASPSITQNTFAIDPNFRIGYAQNWQVTVQRDLPGSLQMAATYLGIKGTRGMQEFLPNTFPAGAVNPCPTCPSGFAYLTSNGNSTREAAQIQLRRRLHNGLTGTLEYTFSKAIDDDAALGGQGASATARNTAGQNSSNPSGPSTQLETHAAGPANLAIAQNWLNLAAERSLSAFDQRHQLSFELQYTTGMGVGGGTLLSGWKARLFNEWTFATQITAATGLPETPVYLAPVQGTGITGSLRPDYTGAPLHSAPSGLALNPAAYAAPLAGEWGDAGRNSITGPAQFTWNASLGRTFRLGDKLHLDWRADAVNALNHVTFTTWNTTLGGAQFGLPASANAMRNIETTLRLRF